MGLAVCYVYDTEIAMHSRRGYIDMTTRRGLRLPDGFDTVDMLSQPMLGRIRVVVAHPLLDDVPDGDVIPEWPFVSVAALNHLRLSPSRLDC